MRAGLRIALVTLAAAVVLAATAGVARAADHQAHAVPGDPRVVYDVNGDGVERVELDGRSSHSHYFAAGPPVVNGAIVRYAWRNPGAASRGRVLCSTAVCVLELEVGEHWIELTVWDQMGADATAGVLVTVLGGVAVRSERSAIVKINPREGTVKGNQLVKIEGSGFVGEVEVRFGGKLAKWVNVVSESVVEALSPQHAAGKIDVTVSTNAGRSIGAKFAYQPVGVGVAWSETAWRNKNGTEWTEAEEVSGIVVGPDGRYYLSTLVGKVWAVDVGPDFVVQSACGVEIAPGRAIYSVGWNPADPRARLVVSTNKMWFRDAGSYWHNSKVEFVNIGGKNDECLTHGGIVIENLVRFSLRILPKDTLLIRLTLPPRLRPIVVAVLSEF